MIKHKSYSLTKSQIGKIKEQEVLFTQESFLPQNLPHPQELHPAHNLSAIFNDCHNYVYANEGLLKDKIFHEIVKLLVMKLFDEQNSLINSLQFGITSSEYKSILGGMSNSFETRIFKLFEEVRNKYPSLLSDYSLKLKPLTLAYIINRLQYINISQTPGDVKGEAFQAFVYKNQRGDRGEFFTPHPIVKLAVEIIDPKPFEKVIDPACGSGGFLIQTLSHIWKNDPCTNREDYIRQHVFGIEFNPDVAFSAMVRLVFEGGTGKEIIYGNALLDNEDFNNSFDIVLTNPPFGSKGKIEDQKILKSYLLARKWDKTQNGKWEVTRNVLQGQSPEILFIEKCMKLLRPGGRMAIVLPEGLLQNISNSHIRYWIRSQAKVLSVISIPQEAFIPYGTGIKTSLIVLQKLPADAKTVFMARIKKIGYDVKGQAIYKRDVNGKKLLTLSNMGIVDDDIQKISLAYDKFKNEKYINRDETFYAVPENILNSRLDVEHYLPEDQKLLKKLRNIGSKSLNEVADIINGMDDFRLESYDDIRYISISDVDSRTMQVIFQQTIKPHEAPSRATYRVRKGDIITAISGASTGTARQASALITNDEDGAICSNGFAVLRNIRLVEPLFLLAYMRTQYFLRQVKRLMTGHAIPAISTEDLAKVLVPIPSIDVQKKISDEIASILKKRKEAFKAGEKTVEETESVVEKMTR